MSLFITFEGIEGSGKTTQVLRLLAHLRSRGCDVVATREPGGCDLSDRIRNILLDPQSSSMSPRTELLLYSAARAQHVDEFIRPALQAGKIVLCDRFSDATMVYQGSCRGLDLSLLEIINRFAADDLTPDMTMVLDYPVDDGLRRARQRNSAGDLESEGRFELEALSFHQRVRQGYLDLAAQQLRFHVIDALGAEDVVAGRIACAVDDFLASRSRA